MSTRDSVFGVSFPGYEVWGSAFSTFEYIWQSGRTTEEGLFLKRVPQKRTILRGALISQMMEEYEGAAGLLYRPFEQMQDLYEKLIILKYHEECMKMAKARPIHSLYFTNSTNPGEQYYNFVFIASWLIKKCNRSINMPQESDDPNMIITGILEHLKALGAKVEYGPSKVKSGSGPEVVGALSFLTNMALTHANIHWEEIRPEDPHEAEDEVLILDEQEVNLDKIEEEMEQAYSSDDEEAGWIQQSHLDSKPSQDEDQKMLKSDVDIEGWRLELERVLPQLKITVKTDGQDWRWRQEQMKSHVTGITTAVNQIEAPLKRLVTEAQAMSEKVLSRETFLNTQFVGLLDELHHSQEKLSKMKETHKELSNKVAEKNKSLAHLSEELEHTRQQLEDRGSIMADGAPVVTVKKNLTVLKKELGDMEVEIGVMDHSVMKSLVHEQIILRDKNKF